MSQEQFGHQPDRDQPRHNNPELISNLYDSIVESFEILELFSSPDTAVYGEFSPLKGLATVYVADGNVLAKKADWSLEFNKSQTSEFGYQERSIRLYSQPHGHRGADDSLLGAIGFLYNPENRDILLYEEVMVENAGSTWIDVLKGTDKHLKNTVAKIKHGR